MTATAQRTTSSNLTCQEILKDYQPRQKVLTPNDIPSTPFRHLASLAVRSIYPFIIAMVWWTFSIIKGQSDKPIEERVSVLPSIQISLIVMALIFGMVICAIVFCRAYWAKRHGCSHFEAGYAFATNGIGHDFAGKSWYREIAPEVIRTARFLDECGELIARLQRVIDTPSQTGIDPLGDNREDILRIIEETRAIHPGLARI